MRIASRPRGCTVVLTWAPIIIIYCFVLFFPPILCVYLTVQLYIYIYMGPEKSVRMRRKGKGKEKRGILETVEHRKREIE